MYLLVQYDDRNTDQFKYLIETNKNYAKKMNIEYLFLSSGYEKYPPYWRKVFLVSELLNLYEGVLWMDSDAAVVKEKHFKDYFEDKHFIFSPNPPPALSVHLEFLAAPLCAGIWAVKNTPEGHTVMNAWKQSYDASTWKNENGKWKCSGVYAGKDYEQGSFELNLFRVKDYKQYIKSYPFEVFNYVPRKDTELFGKICESNIFSVHYWTGQRTQISSHFKKALFSE